MPKIVTVVEMIAIEKAANESGLTYDAMMQNAGKSVARILIEELGSVDGKRISILCGSGNNGGDGLVSAGCLAEAGAHVSVYMSTRRDQDDPLVSPLQRQGMLVADAEADQRFRVLKNMLATADIIVDGLLGTGIRLPLRGTVKSILTVTQNVLKKREIQPVWVAIDSPSGLDTDSGEAASQTPYADFTVTLAAAKVGLLKFPGATHVGKLIVGEIGIPDNFKELEDVDLELATAEAVSAYLPDRPKDAHKGTFGKSVIIAGSINYPGAALLAAKGAYRSGAGLVTLVVPAPVQSIIASAVPEATWFLLPHEMGVLVEEGVTLLEEFIGPMDAVLIGPGIGREVPTEKFLAKLLGNEDNQTQRSLGFRPSESSPDEFASIDIQSCVIDADGLRILAGMEDWPARLPEGSVLTPHPGEMAALAQINKEEVQKDRVDIAKKYAGQWGHFVVLKGAFTVIASPEGETTVMPFATPALARAGTGDVLAGVIVGLRAQGLPPYEAAILGAYLHGRAGELAAERARTTSGVLASDVLQSLPAAYSELESIAGISS